MTLTASTVEALRELQQTCGDTAASKGFHDDRPFECEHVEMDEGALANWQGNKLLLIVSEVIEAHDEIRNGRAADETYYPEPALPNSLVAEVGVAEARELINADLEGKARKPEGVPSEIADAVIRCFDFAYTEGFDLAGIIAEKLVYNASRERLHGKKF
ncbi:pyrophosphatase [Arthrobacter phage Auxilium]|uniref:MazG-like nucleotide pyrophosphohydrolase n=1 Tax=Arthrobacter phage Auxilium TaxID=2419948 RepID=A0A3G2KA57_9CAUD|nr:pyrophosphatase [Arthrobacter phage Auxilium]AYN55857.1 MazG-like nucleotide pyrophosphohydrolase [Arthrobacter phage Auxilium]